MSSLVPYGTFTSPVMDMLHAQGGLTYSDTIKTGTAIDFVDNMLSLTEYNRRSDLLTDMLDKPAKYLTARQREIAKLTDETKKHFVDKYVNYYLDPKKAYESAADADAKKVARVNLIPEYNARKIALDDSLAYFQAGMEYVNEKYPTEFGGLAFEIGGAKHAAAHGTDLESMKEALRHIQPGSI